MVGGIKASALGALFGIFLLPFLPMRTCLLGGLCHDCEDAGLCNYGEDAGLCSYAGGHTFLILWVRLAFKLWRG
jgi:hypothetical protein